MVELNASGLSIGDRAKVRVLLGDRARLGSLFPPASTAPGRLYGKSKPSADAIVNDLQDGRRLQDTGSSGTPYATIAIVLSVLIDAVGYMVQAWSTRRADRSVAGCAVHTYTAALGASEDAAAGARADDCADRADGALAGSVLPAGCAWPVHHVE